MSATQITAALFTDLHEGLEMKDPVGQAQMGQLIQFPRPTRRKAPVLPTDSREDFLDRFRL